MNQETVYQLFLASYQPSLEAREQAELNIKNVHWLNWEQKITCLLIPFLQ